MLDSGKLQSGILTVCSDPGPSSAACAQQWAEAMRGYAAAVLPASVAVDTAAAALATGLEGAFAAGLAAPLMESAFAAFAGTVGAGMAGFAPTPPPRPVGFASLFLQPAPTTHAQAASRTAALIDSWMRSGTATPPGGAPVPWS